MRMISVRAKKGRIAYDRPNGGVKLSETEFTSIEATPYILRLINFWGDVVVEDVKTNVKPPVAASQPLPQDTVATPQPPSAVKK